MNWGSSTTHLGIKISQEEYENLKNDQHPTLKCVKYSSYQCITEHLQDGDPERVDHLKRKHQPKLVFDEAQKEFVFPPKERADSDCSMCYDSDKSLYYDDYCFGRKITQYFIPLGYVRQEYDSDECIVADPIELLQHAETLLQRPVQMIMFTFWKESN